MQLGERFTGSELSNGTSHAFLWMPVTPNGVNGTMIDLDTLGGGTNSSGQGINSSGQVTGYNSEGAFLWTPTTPNGVSGTMTHLHTNGSGVGINASGQVTGGNSGGAFLWTPTTPNGVDGTMTNLNSLSSAPAGWRLESGHGINDSGQIAGNGTNANGESHAFIATPYIPTLGKRFILSSPGEIVGGLFNAESHGINNRGDVVGMSGAPGGDRAFLKTANGTLQDLGTLPNGSEYSRADAINDNGYVAGVNSTGNQYGHAFVWDPTTQTKTDLGEMTPGTGSIVGGMNNSQTVVGVSAAEGVSAAFVWDSANGIQPLAHFGFGLNSYASGINDQGQIVGYAETGHGQHAVLWTDHNTITDLGTLVGPNGNSAARAINAMGQVAGESDTSSGARHAFLYDAGGMHGLGTLVPGGMSDAFAINVQGWVVGDSSTATGTHAFLWTPTHGMEDLNDLFDNGGLGWTLIAARSINNQGQIAGYALDELGHERSFVLSPLAGDVNFDGVVNIFDINLVSSYWGEAGPVGDANSDGTVNIFDINLISSNWAPTGRSTAVPEPSSLVFAVLGLVALSGRSTSRVGKTLRSVRWCEPLSLFDGPESRATSRGCLKTGWRRIIGSRFCAGGGPES